MLKIVILTFMLLVFQIKTGPLAIGVWTVLCQSCAAGCLLTGPGYSACMIACCGTGSLASWLACFSEETTIETPNGIVLLNSVAIGDLVLT